MDLVSLYNDGSASEASRKAVNEHLKECPDCRKFYKQYRIITNRKSTFRDTISSSQEQIYTKLLKKFHRRRNTINISLVLYSCVAAGTLAWCLLKHNKGE